MQSKLSDKVDVDYRQLIHQKKFQEAVEILTAMPEASAEDRQSRDLAFCLMNLQEPSKAIDMLQECDNLEFQDYYTLVFSHWQLADWNNMASTLKAMLKIKQQADIYYYLAVAESGDKPRHRLDEANKQIIRGYLLQAVQFENCELRPLLWLADMYEPEDYEKRTQLLEDALKRFPAESVVRLRLAKSYIHFHHKYPSALEVLKPLLQVEEVLDEARWYQIEALLELNKYNEALQQIELIKFDDASKKSRIQSDIFFRKGDISSWAITAEQYTNAHDISSAVRGHFRRAYINLQNSNLAQAVSNFECGISLIFRHEVVLDNFLFVSLGNSYVSYFEHDIVLDVCETLLLLNEDTSLPSEIIGKVLYVAYRFYDQQIQQEIEELIQLDSESILISAAERLNYPPEIGNYLCMHFLDSDLPTAIENHLAYCSWAHKNGVEYDAEIPEYAYYGRKDAIEEQKTHKAQDIHEISFGYLKHFRDLRAVTELWQPFYKTFWRDLLFENKLFAEVVDICHLFEEAEAEHWYLFDYAYSLDALDRSLEARSLYEELLEREPNNASAHNNLAVILERNGEIVKAYALYQKAIELEPSKHLYNSNLNRIAKQVQLCEQAQQNFQDVLQSIQRKALEAGLNKEQQRELNELYWNSETSVKKIQALLRKGNIYSLITPLLSNEKCPNCYTQLAYKSRTGRASNDAICLGCGHKKRGWCRCDFCQQKREKQSKRDEAARIRVANEEFEELKSKYCVESYVEWAINEKLTRKQKQFLRSFIEVVKTCDEPTWIQICKHAGVVSEKSYLKKLKNLKLLLHKPQGGIISNPAIALDMLNLETVRKISKSLRFDVFQRDSHTCQYCGRKSPEATLVIDHLIPVSKGGTDDFENLVTSCEDCNSGKSDKLIETFTGGFSKEEWRQQIQKKRAEVLDRRRKSVDGVIRHWEKCLGKRSLSDQDEQAIYNFLEMYEPEWINSALSITVQKQIKKYIPYTGAILRNWGKEGLPKYLADPDAGLADRPATEKQVEYIHSLLIRLGLELNQFYEKQSYQELTMLDAKNLIEELTKRQDKEST